MAKIRTMRSPLRRTGIPLSLIAVVALLAQALIAGAAAGKVKPAYCNIPTPASYSWAFHVNKPITGATGTYARGHGWFDSTTTTHGIICQVDRVRGAADRQIILSVGRKILYYKHAVSFGGHLGNILKVSIKVKSSTDPACAVGTVGKLTLTATYNGFHDDTVRMSFPRACKDHDHYYPNSGNVTVLIPRQT